MAYVKQGFVDGNVLHASELNHIEDGIANSYEKPSGGIPGTDIANGAVGESKIAANAVSSVYTATLDTTWTGSSAPYSKVQTINGILASDNPIIDLVPSDTYATAQQQVEAWANIYRVVASSNTLTFYANEKPTVSLPVKVQCIRK